MILAVFHRSVWGSLWVKASSCFWANANVNETCRKKCKNAENAERAFVRRYLLAFKYIFVAAPETMSIKANSTAVLAGRLDPRFICHFKLPQKHLQFATKH